MTATASHATGSGKVDVGDLRSFLAVLGDDDVVVYVAASGFTRDAERDARRERKTELTQIDFAPFAACGSSTNARSPRRAACCFL